MAKETKNKILVDQNPFDWNTGAITGKQLRELAGIGLDSDIYQVKHGQQPDVLVLDDMSVDLTGPGAEHFITKSRPVKLVLIVNGREKDWNEKVISFAQVVMLAFSTYDDNPNKVYTVTFDKGPKENPEGSMVRGDIVFVKNKMVFNVTATDKS